jgi:glycosyltransferase involved in cell wall biosynthesis
MNVITGMLRVQNEARWIARVVGAISPICSKVLIFDDHSTDDTAAICRSIGCSVIPSPFTGLNEARDMQFLYTEAMRSFPKPDWIISIDGDEELEPGGAAKLKAAIESPASNGVSYFRLQILYLWDHPNQIRMDGVYGNYRRKRVFRPAPGASFQQNGVPGNLHCGGAGNIKGLTGRVADVPLRLLHFGYLHREDRIRKWEWHNEVEAGNAAEDGFRHIVQGDLLEVPAAAKLRHAGPLVLKSLVL